MLALAGDPLRLRGAADERRAAAALRATRTVLDDEIPPSGPGFYAGDLRDFGYQPLRARPTEDVTRPRMLISIDKRLAFLAIPKTGTTSMHKALGQHCEIRLRGARRATKHMSMRVFEEFMMPYLREIGAGVTETFCVVRELVDWLGAGTASEPSRASSARAGAPGTSASRPSSKATWRSGSRGSPRSAGRRASSPGCPESRR